jgi:hypothetical protein
MTMTLGDVAIINADRIPMLPGMTVGDYMEMCRSRHPALYRRLALDRLPTHHIARLYAGIAELSTHFESKLEQGMAIPTVRRRTAIISSGPSTSSASSMSQSRISAGIFRNASCWTRSAATEP